MPPVLVHANTFRDNILKNKRDLVCYTPLPTMLVATAIMILGLLGGIVATQLGGYRLGGVIVVPVFAVYLLRSFGTFPVFVLSVIAGYVAVTIVKRNLLLYGRPLFAVALISGAAVPILVFEFVALGFGPGVGIDGIEFVGSILPGIAAYNLHRLSVERRVMDAVWSLALLTFLVVVGIGLVIFVGLTPLREASAPLLLAPGSDIANGLGLAVDRGREQAVTSRVTVLGLVTLGLVLSEVVRDRWGLRLAGVIVVPLLALFSLRNGWLLGLFVATSVFAYLAIRMIHWWTLLYGRVLLSMGIIVGMLTAASLVPGFPARYGLMPFFTGILGGVTAYNLHVVPPVERRATVAATVGMYVVLLGLARVVVDPMQLGILQEVGGEYLVIGIAAVGWAVWEVWHVERIRPASLDRWDTAPWLVDSPREVG